MLKLVPFNNAWINHDKIDVHAIYRRPHRTEDEYGEFIQTLSKDGVAEWDLTGPLPVRQHNRWVVKGYEYVTLAGRQDLLTAAQYGTLTVVDKETGTIVPTADWKQYDQHASGGPWNYRLYKTGQERATTIEADLLRQDVYKFGSDAVETLRKRDNPQFRLPPELQNIAPGAEFKTPEPAVALGVAVAEAPVVAEVAGKKKGAA